MYAGNTWGAGLESHVYLLTLDLLRRGVSVTLAVHPWFARSPQRRSALATAGAELVWLPLVKAPAKVAALARLASLYWSLGRRRFDTVIAHGNGATNYYLRRFTSTGGRFVWHDHLFGAGCNHVGDVFEPPVLTAFPGRLRRTALAADLVVVGSEAGARNLRTLQGRGGEILVAPPLAQVVPPDSVERVRSRDTVLRFGLFGALDHRKGVTQLLNLWGSIDIGPSELHFWGNDPEKQFETRALRLELQNVCFHGAFQPDDLPRLMQDTDIGLVLSVIEGYPLSAWELMTFGVPFVMTPTGAAGELTTNNPDAELADFSPVGVRAAIERIAGKVRAGRTSRRRLQEHARRNFSYESALAKHSSYCPVGKPVAAGKTEVKICS